MDLHAAAKNTDFYLLLACRGYLRNGTRYITSNEIPSFPTSFPDYELEAHIQKRNNWTD